MLCVNCGKREATTHIKQTINGKTTEYHLCAECASALGMSGFNPFDMSDLWSSMFETQVPDIPKTVKCEKCNSTFDQIAKRGRVGCPECYSTFKKELLPSLVRIHGKTHHVGKVPGKASEEIKNDFEIDKLRKELNDAVSREDYETAAKLRDKIKLIESKEGDSNE